MEESQFEELKSEMENISSNTSYGVINYNELRTINKRLQNIEYWLEENNILMKELVAVLVAKK